MKILALSLLGLIVVSEPLAAQQYGRPQDGFYSGQSNSQYDGQLDLRVDGRGSRNEGFPPSAADKDNRVFDNPLNAYDCAEVNAFAPSAKPGWQDRVRDACQK